MKIVFRADASIEMGIGHVMRCLTLAGALRGEGAECHFICREHPGNLAKKISDDGYRVHLLPFEQRAVPALEAALPVHAHWLGGDWQKDVQQTVDCIGTDGADWLIVDHYALDERWEKRMRPSCRKIMVIDDLADRKHDCDLLLDQTYGQPESRYQGLVPEGCQILAGARFALLRAEFAELREYSLQRREKSGMERLLVSLGGVDKDNMTGNVLQVLKQAGLPESSRITVVMGKNSPWLEAVQQQVSEWSSAAELRIDAADMAQLMANSDLAIGAAGSTAWERCCLGVPTLMFVLADNQRVVASALSEAGAVRVMEGVEKVAQVARLSMEELETMSRIAAGITDGRGVNSVVAILKRS